MKIPDLEIGKRLTVGANPIPVTCFGIGPTEIRGTAAIQGPLLVGASQSFPIPNAPEASVMIARTTNPEAPVVPSILKVNSRGFPPTPIDVMIGDVTGPVGILVNSLVITILNATTITVTSPSTIINSSTIHNGPVVVNGFTVVNSAAVVTGLLASSVNVITGPHVLSAKKNFDIPHPSKKGWRLRHTCPEAPYNDVYIRGKLLNEDKIQLPDYWKKFVDIESITVQLQPIGIHQNIIVKRIDQEFVYLQSNGGMPIQCHYHVYATRKDGDMLVPEYKGLTSDDYPGDNSQYNINM